MDTTYFPPKKTGTIVVLIFMVFLLLASGVLLVQASKNPANPHYLGYVLAGFGLLLPFVALLYRLYTVQTMKIILGRGGLALRWGLNREIIPMNELRWVRPVSEIKPGFPLPIMSLPGSYFGKRQVPGVGLVNFVVSDRKRMVLVSTARGSFCISPDDVTAFTQQFDRLTELGLLGVWEGRSENLGSLWKGVWKDRTARTSIMLGAIGVALLVGLTVLLTASRDTIVWVTLETVPSQRLFLLAGLDFFAWLMTLLVGLFFYFRGGIDKIMIYLFWVVSIVVTLLLLTAILIMSL